MFSEEELLGALKGRIFYNPLVTGYEIKDRFIAGNVIEKAERIEAWIDGNPESERLPEVRQSLEALKEAEPEKIPFEDLDFNFGERWIPTGVYAAYMSRLFDTEVKIAYSASLDEFSVACGCRTMKITDEFLVKGYYRIRNGFSEWLEEQSPQFKERLTTMYNRKFNCYPEAENPIGCSSPNIRSIVLWRLLSLPRTGVQAV